MGRPRTIYGAQLAVVVVLWAVALLVVMPRRLVSAVAAKNVRNMGRVLVVIKYVLLFNNFTELTVCVFVDWAVLKIGVIFVPSSLLNHLLSVPLTYSTHSAQSSTAAGMLYTCHER